MNNTDIKFDGCALALLSLLFQIADTTIGISLVDYTKKYCGSFNLPRSTKVWIEKKFAGHGWGTFFILHDLKRALKVNNCKVQGDYSLEQWETMFRPWMHLINSTEGLSDDDIINSIDYISKVFDPSIDNNAREVDSVVRQALRFARNVVGGSHVVDLIEEQFLLLTDAPTETKSLLKKVIIPIIELGHAVYAVVSWLDIDQFDGQMFEVCICNGGKSCFLFHTFFVSEWERWFGEDSYLGHCIFTCNKRQLMAFVAVIDKYWKTPYLLYNLFGHLVMNRLSLCNPIVFMDGNDLFHGRCEKYAGLEVCVRQQTVGNCAVHNLWQAVRHCSVSYVDTTGLRNDRNRWELSKKALLGRRLRLTIESMEDEIVGCSNINTYYKALDMAEAVAKSCEASSRLL